MVWLSCCGMVVFTKKTTMMNDDAQIEHHQQTMILQGFCSVLFWGHSFQVIPGTILVEFEFHLKFRWNHYTVILAVNEVSEVGGAMTMGVAANEVGGGNDRQGAAAHHICGMGADQRPGCKQG